MKGKFLSSVAAYLLVLSLILAAGAGVVTAANGQDTCKDVLVGSTNIDIGGEQFQITVTADPGYLLTAVCFKGGSDESPNGYLTVINFDPAQVSYTFNVPEGGAALSHYSFLQVQVVPTPTPTDLPNTPTPTDPVITPTPTGPVITPTPTNPPRATPTPFTPPDTGAPAGDNASASFEGSNAAISIPALGIEASVYWSWSFPEFCRMCGWEDVTYWETHKLMGFHAPFWNALYNAKPGMTVHFAGVHAHQYEDYIIMEVETVADDTLLSVDDNLDLAIIICAPDYPWPERIIIRMLKIENVGFIDDLNDYWRFL